MVGHEKTIAFAAGLVCDGRLSVAIDVMLASAAGACRPLRRVGSCHWNELGLRLRAERLAHSDPDALARMTVAAGVVTLMRAIGGGDPAVLAQESRVLLGFADRSRLEAMVGGADRAERFFAAVLKMQPQRN